MATGNVSATLHFVKKYPITLCGFSLLFMPSVHRLLFYFSPLLLSTAIFVVAMASWGPRPLNFSSSGAFSDEESVADVKDDEWSDTVGHGSSRSAGADGVDQTGNPAVRAEPDPDFVELELHRDQHVKCQEGEPDPDLVDGPRPEINGDTISFESSPDMVDGPSAAAIAEKAAQDDEPGAVQHPREDFDTAQCEKETDRDQASHAGPQVELEKVHDNVHVHGHHQTFTKSPWPSSGISITQHPLHVLQAAA